MNLKINKKPLKNCSVGIYSTVGPLFLPPTLPCAIFMLPM